MGILRSETVTVTTSGSAGSATGAAATPAFLGEIVGIELNWSASAPATSDVSITSTRSGVEIASEDNNVADKYIVPVIYGEDKDGAALAGNVTPMRPVVDAGLTFTIAGCDALAAALVATVHYRK